MSKTQKIIKYFAIALAVLIIFSILSLISRVFISIGGIFDNNKSSFEEYIVKDKINYLDISLSTVNIKIVENNKFKIETNNKYIEYKIDNNKVFINEKKHSIFKNDDNDLIIYIPSTITFDKVSLSNGAGYVDIETLNTKNLELNLGAGRVDVDNLNVLNNADIEGGAGSISIKDSKLYNLDLDMGIGNLTLESILYGDNNINAGIGSLDINIIGNIEDYKVKVDKGLGKVKLNGDVIDNDTYYGNGINRLDIDGGIGNIIINFK